MKKVLFALMLLASTSAFAANDPIENTFSRYKCMMCHSVDRKIVGPSFKDVAKKYRGENAETNLIRKVSQGGYGNWGQTAMPANDKNLANQPDIKRMVKYILSLQ